MKLTFRDVFVFLLLSFKLMLYVQLYWYKYISNVFFPIYNFKEENADIY